MAKAKTKKPVAKKPKKKPVVAKPKKKPVVAKPKKKPKKPTKKPVVAPAPAVDERPRVALGEVTAPSGELAIFDVGLFGFLPRAALDPAIIFVPVPRDRALAIVGERVGKGRFADCWDHLAVELVPDARAHATHARKLGEAGVDFARIFFVDRAALDHWQHDEALDGKADWLCWGRDAAALARALRAPKLAEGYGFVDLAVADAEALELRAQTLKAQNRWLLATDLRRHSHHFHALAAARAAKTGAGTLELAGTHALLAFTSWGDGVFPVYLDLDADDHPVQIRVQLASAVERAQVRETISRTS